MALYGRALRRGGRAAWGTCGAALGAAITTRYNLGLLGAVLLLAELLRAWHDRARPWREARGLAVAAATSAGVFLAVHIPLYLGLYGRGALARFLDTLRIQTTTNLGVGKEPPDVLTYLPALAVTISPVVLLLGAAGVLLALVRREPRDLPFLAWLLVLGGFAVAVVKFHDGRYGLPAAPALLYFALRALEAARQALAGSRGGRLAGDLLAVAAVGGAVLNGADQVRRDRDPVFTDDVERKAASRVLEARKPGGRLLWMGNRQTLFPRDAKLIPGDDYFNVFQYGGDCAAYFTDEEFLRVPPRLDPETTGSFLAALALDGDALLRVDPGAYLNLNLPDDALPPMEVWRIHRVELLPVHGGRLASPDGAVEIRTDEVPPVAVALRDLGTWALYTRAGPEEPPRFLGILTLPAGRPVPLPAAASAPSAVLLRADPSPVR